MTSQECSPKKTKTLGVQNARRERTKKSKNKETSQNQSNNEIFLWSSNSFHISNPSSHKVVSHRDSTDTMDDVYCKHLLSNFLGMVKYSSGLNCAKINAEQKREATKSQRSTPVDGIVQFGKRDWLSTREYLGEPDFIEVLLYDCYFGGMLAEFEKMLNYLDEVYFVPIDPKRVNLEEGKEEEEEEEEEEEKEERFLLNSQILGQHFVDGSKERQHQAQTAHCALSPEPEGTAKKIRESIRCIGNYVRLAEEKALKEHDAKIETLERSLLGVVESFALRGEETKENADFVYLQGKLRLETESVRYATSCEEAYIYVKYFALLIIAFEKDVAAEVSKLVNPKKFSNFPLYLNLLATEIENTPFSVKNASMLVSEFVKSAGLFYSLGVVKRSLLDTFYSHPMYDNISVM